MNKNPLKIVSSRIGYSNAVLILNGSKNILVDTGVKGNFKHFKILFRQHQLRPEDIQLIVLTHVHYDHTGNLKALSKYTGAKVLVHRKEYENLKNGFIQIPA
ncbi:MAG TPA: MBL fold metallo-hydrolase, partial [Draconibacterium sp.]|nr:MBL fold metallo-hydrolase [Draconibacterium sp.]